MRGRTGGGSGWRRAEPALVAVGLAALAAAVLGGYVVDAGFFNDDWVYLSGSLWPAEPGLLGHLREFEWLSFRPLMIPYWPALFNALGTRPGWHEAWLLVTCAAQAGLGYALLRRFGHRPADAALMAALVLLLPLAASTRLWPAMSANVLAVVLWLAGLHAGLTALERRSRTLWVLAVALPVAGVLLYEIAAAAVIAGGALYVLRAGRRGALLWAVTAVAVLVTLATVTSGTFYDPLGPSATLRHAAGIARDSVIAAARVLWAPGAWTRPTAVLACLALAACLGAAGLVLRRGTGERRSEARLWLSTAAAGAVVAAAGYVMLAPSDTLGPLGQGQFDRGNLVAGMGLVVFVYSALAAGAVAVTPRALPRLALTALLVLPVLAGSVLQLRDEADDWRRAAGLQERSLEAIERAIGRPRPGSTVLTVGAPAEAAPGVPVFAAVWDLEGALQLRFRDQSLRGYPVPPGTRIECGGRALRLRNYNDRFEAQLAPYGRSVVVDVAARRAHRLDGAGDCRRIAAITPG